MTINHSIHDSWMESREIKLLIFQALKVAKSDVGFEVRVGEVLELLVCRIADQDV